jgi:catechol 2,3-dioxygenase-like lactoylglutathione lyase family enzyme
VTIVVKDQDEALEFYTEVLGMEKVTDITRAGQRFVTVGPAGQKSVEQAVFSIFTATRSP